MVVVELVADLYSELFYYWMPVSLLWTVSRSVHPGMYGSRRP